MRKLIVLLVLAGMLISAGGCALSSLQIVVVSAMGTTTTAMVFDKEIYKAMKESDFFMIDPEQYMPEPVVDGEYH